MPSRMPAGSWPIPSARQRPILSPPRPPSLPRCPTSRRCPKSARWIETRETVGFLIKLALFVLLLRTLIFSPFSIPSESMLPRLLIGDYLFISKWNYGYSRHALPFRLPLGSGRIFGRLPERGDVVVFKAPPAAREDWIKRVIGLPGDTVQVRDGTVILNGVAIPKQQVADFIVPVSPNYTCDAAFQDVDAPTDADLPLSPIPRNLAGWTNLSRCSIRATIRSPIIPASTPCRPATFS